MAGIDVKDKVMKWYGLINTYTRTTWIYEEDGPTKYHIYAKFHDNSLDKEDPPAHVRHIKDIKSEYPNLF